MPVRLKMKDLEARTGVTREAIHFYLREGLLPEPDRPKRNVAHYSEEHVVRIRAIKRLQHERALSLGAIKGILADFDYDALPTGDLAEFEIAVQARVNGELPARDQTLASVVERTGLGIEFLRQADALGIIAIKKRTDGEQVLDFRDVGILEQWAKLMEIGFRGKPGYDLAYLRRFADAIGAIAEAEVDHFLRVFDELPTDDSAALAAEGIGITNEIVTRLRTQSLMRALQRRVRPSPSARS